jgi:hypothetical protein
MLAQICSEELLPFGFPQVSLYHHIWYNWMSIRGDPNLNVFRLGISGMLFPDSAASSRADLTYSKNLQLISTTTLSFCLTKLLPLIPRLCKTSSCLTICQSVVKLRMPLGPDQYLHVSNRSTLLIDVDCKSKCGHTHIKPALLRKCL